MGEMGIKFLIRLFNKLLGGERMPEVWRRSVLIPIYKNKEDAQYCENYRGIKLMSHIMKVWERIIEARLRNRVEISNSNMDLCQERKLSMPCFLCCANANVIANPGSPSVSSPLSLRWRF